MLAAGNQSISHSNWVHFASQYGISQGPGSISVLEPVQSS